METTPCFTDDLLNFPSDISDIDNDNDNDNDDVLSPHHHRRLRRRHAFSLLPHPSEFVEEEELEWISNKDAFPMVETFVDIIPNNASCSSSSNINNNNNNNSGSDLSPVSVLENSSTSGGSINSFNFSITKRRNESKHHNNNNDLISLRGIFKVPGKARSKQLRKPRREMSRKWFQCWEKTVVSKPSIGRKCLHCGSEKTPQWRAGPLGPKTLCNACGVRYKSGRLVPEYRPASSPTFSSEVHSNSHRKIVEMRKQKMMMMGGEAEFKPGDF